MDAHSTGVSPVALDYPCEKDLASIACRAAIELDNHLLNRGAGVGAIEQLRKLVSESMPIGNDPLSANWLSDPSATLVVNRAIYGASNVSALDDLVAQANTILEKIASLLENPTDFVQHHKDEAVKMRGFCLALSRSATSTKPSPLDRNEGSTFRR